MSEIKKLNFVVSSIKYASKKKKLLAGSLDRARWVLEAQRVYPEVVSNPEKEALERIVKAGQLWLKYHL